MAVVADEDRLIAVDVAEGQRNDAPLALPVLAEAKRVLGRIDEVLTPTRSAVRASTSATPSW